MSHRRRLRTTRRSPAVETSARKPSHFGSTAYPRWVGSGEERRSIGTGNRVTGWYILPGHERLVRWKRLLGKGEGGWPAAKLPTLGQSTGPPSRESAGAGLQPAP